MLTTLLPTPPAAVAALLLLALAVAPLAGTVLALRRSRAAAPQEVRKPERNDPTSATLPPIAPRPTIRRTEP